MAEATTKIIFPRFCEATSSGDLCFLVRAVSASNWATRQGTAVPMVAVWSSLVPEDWTLIRTIQAGFHSAEVITFASLIHPAANSNSPEIPETRWDTQI